MNRQLGYHAVFGSGGSKAILGGAGAIAAFEIAGMREWLSIGSCSGGSLPGVFLASGKPAAQVLGDVVNTDFESLLRPKAGLVFRVLALLMKYRNELRRPQRGVYSAAPLGAFVRSQVGEWPERFWTVSSGKRGAYVFAKNQRFFEKGDVKVDSALPALPLAEAVMASCAVPGIIDGVRYARDLLHDGALTHYGECPAAVPVRYFGARPEQVIAFDIEPEPLKQRSWLRLAWQAACMGQCAPFDAVHLPSDGGYIVIRPNITGFHGLQFSLDRATKWNAICTGFEATAATLLAHGLVHNSGRRAALRRISHRICKIRSGSSTCSFSAEIEALMAEHELFAFRRKQ